MFYGRHSPATENLQEQSFSSTLRQLVTAPLLLSAATCASATEPAKNKPLVQLPGNIKQALSNSHVVLPSITQAIELAKEDKISQVKIILDGSLGTAYFITGKDGKSFLLPFPSDEQAPQRDEFHSILSSCNPPITVSTELTRSQKFQILGDFMGMAIMVGAGGMLVAFGLEARKRNPFKVVTSDTKFKDVRGNPENIATMKGLIDLVNKSKNIAGAKAPQGVLLVGPPGTGKTLLARAVAGEMRMKFIACTGSDFDSMFVSQGTAKVKTLFRIARRNSPCIVFIDEIDALGAKRTARTDAVSRESVKIQNAFLTELDGFQKRNKGVIVIGATNRSEVLDEAFTRPGRFDRTIHIIKPITVEQRADIIDLYLENKKQETEVAADVTSLEIAGITSDFSPAELAEVMNSAAFNALQNGRPNIIWDDIFEAVDRIKLGEKLQCVSIPDHERERIIVHEFLGHLVMAVLLEKNISKVSTIPRQKALAHVAIKEEPGVHLYTSTNYIREILLLMSGAAAEQVALGEYSNGAKLDFARARQLAREMAENRMLEVSRTTQQKSSPKARIQEFLKAHFDLAVEILGQIDEESRSKLLSTISNTQTVYGAEINRLIEASISQDSLARLKQAVVAGVARIKNLALAST